MTDPAQFPTEEQLAKDTIRAALGALTIATNPRFDQILWDPVRHVLSFRCWPGEYVNLWLNANDGVDGSPHHVERNGGPAADSTVLWEDS